MEAKLKQRVLGGIVVLALAVILIPFFLSRSNPTPQQITLDAKIPPAPTVSTVDAVQTQQSQQLTPPQTSPSASATQPAFNIYTQQDNTVAAPAPAVVQQQQPVVPPVTTAPPAAITIVKQPPAPKPAPIVAAKPLAVNNKQAWAIQVGSFSQPQNAQALAARLKASGIPAYTQTSKTDKGHTTRVYVGPETNRDKAETTVAVLQQKFQIKAVIVPYNTTL